MNNYLTPMNIICAEDDPDDRMMTQEAFDECELKGDLTFVENGEELMSYLNRNKQFQELENQCLPDLILLDLNMPKKDGKDCISEIKKDPTLKKIPIVVLTTSNDEDDILKTYNLGVSSYITKPVQFDAMVDIFKTIHQYWFNTVRLPKN
ncbi:response regulator [Flammeovirga yaeyamensis]|uniref:Response regulator n=1 Tax=Flammeovirga yaeyamensis TaxID=367791 RepID=A0AAX1N5Y0_9BACT|nr:response regulator [Flammeovirga yaeyamensis]MBB3697427.1 CheY-like chemotaxis protein [Flammeovirga yaeyamensis]NMF36121.1 response regulator [Flammeovirga yaeyamensis]QWG02854.1 response regulator [Flammeovirga yaeyamensis]